VKSAPPVNGPSSDISCRAMKSVLVYFQLEFGRKRLLEVLAKMPRPVDIKTLEDENSWISFADGQMLMDAFVEGSGDPEFARKAGRLTMSREVLGLLYTFFRAIGSPKMMYPKLVEMAPNQTNISAISARGSTRRCPCCGSCRWHALERSNARLKAGNAVAMSSAGSIGLRTCGQWVDPSRAARPWRSWALRPVLPFRFGQW
jgi:hypothetical protein